MLYAPAALCLAALSVALFLGSGDPSPTRPLFAFDDDELVSSWRPVHDSVMGGVSDGRAIATGEAARFEGEVRLENNGGFASFRLGARMPDLATYDGLRLRVRGDGQTYKLSLRTDGRWDGVSWQASFATEDGAWTTVDVPFDELAPSWRGRLVGGTEPFDASSIREVGIVIADKQVGDFAFEIASVEAFGVGSVAEEGSRAAASERTASLARLVDEGASDADLAEHLRWRERLVVIAAPQQLGPEASIQLGRLLAAGDELAARELRIFHLMGNAGGRVAGRTLSADQVRGLRGRWVMPTGDWQVVLIGKDGSVKERWSEPVDVAEIFELVDGMPMRSREVSERRTH